MAIKNILIKKNNGKEWDELHPITTSTNVKHSNGSSVERMLFKLENYKGSTSGTDGNGIDTVIEYRRANDTLYLKKTLSNPNQNGQYKTDTWVEYDKDGVTVKSTIVWTYGYKDTDTNSKAMPNSWSWVVV